MWLLVGTVGTTAACVVPSFDVAPAPMATGGNATSGSSAASGGASGKPTGGGNSGGKVSSGGAGGTSLAGNLSAAGSEQAGSAGNQAGSGNEAGATGNARGPVRVGISMFHDSAGGDDDASADSVDASFAKPPGTKPGDFMLVFFGADHELNISKAGLAPSGWKLLAEQAGYGTDGQGTYLLYKVATDAEPDPIVFAGVDPKHYGIQGLLSVYRGVDPTNPINDYAANVLKTGSASSTEVETPTPPITTNVDDCLLIAGLSPDTAVDAPTISTWPAGFDENQVSVTNPAHPLPNGWANIYSAERHQSKAGAVPTSAFGWKLTYGGQEYYGSMTFVVALAPTP
jgi:hypothetical protein